MSQNKVYSILSLALLLSFIYPQALPAQNKVALVIGNAAYSTPLTTPVNDAKDMAQILEFQGYEVSTQTDATRRQTLTAIRDFADKLSNASHGIFYYSGHAAQDGGQNYLIPVDADIQSRVDLEYNGVPLNALSSRLTGNGPNIIILDAARNNVFPDSGTGPKGLAQLKRQPAESFFIYSSAPNTTVKESLGRNSYLTASLLKFINTPGVEIEDMMKLVSADAARASGGQLPWFNSSLTSGLYLSGSDGDPEAISPPAAAPTASSMAEAELSTYSGKHRKLGQAIKDPVLAGQTVITVAPLPNGNYEWTIGPSSGKKSVRNGALLIDSLDISAFANSLRSSSAAKLLLSLGADNREFVLSYNPAEIYSWQDLQAMRQNLSENYVLKQNIAFPDLDGNGKGDYDFEPVGRSLNGSKSTFKGISFSGIFDGGRHSIQYLYIDRPDENYVGLFGMLDKEASVFNVTLLDVYVVGKRFTGAMTGFLVNMKSIKDTHFTGTVMLEKGIAGGLLPEINKNEISIGGGNVMLQGSVMPGGLLSSGVFSNSLNLEYFRNFKPKWDWGIHINYVPEPQYGIDNLIVQAGLRYKGFQNAPVSGFLGFGGGVFSRFVYETEVNYSDERRIEHAGITFYLELGFQINTRSGIFFSISTDGWIGAGNIQTFRVIDGIASTKVNEELTEFYKWDGLSISIGYRF